MNCTEAREYLFAFLDNESGTALSIDLQHHIEHCAECAREVEIERAIRAGLGRRLRLVPLESSMDESHLARSLEDSDRVERSKGRTNRRWLLATGVAAVLLVGGILISVKPPETASTHAEARTADLLAADFDHFLKKGQPLQIHSQDQNAVSAWYGNQVKFKVLLPEKNGGHCRLVGGRKCRIGGREAAFTMYKMEKTPASLVIFTAHPDDLDGMTLVSSGGRNHWIDRCKGHTVVAQRRGDLIYAVISTLPESQLFHLFENEQS